MNWEDPSEVVKYLCSKEFIDRLDSELAKHLKLEAIWGVGVRDDNSRSYFCYGGITESFRSLIGHSMSEPVCASAIRSQSNAEDAITALVTFALMELKQYFTVIQSAGGVPVATRWQMPVRIQWTPWNQYDREFNPEMLLVRYKAKIEVTWKRDGDEYPFNQ